MFDRKTHTYHLPFGIIMEHTESFVDDKKIADYWKEIYNGYIINETNGTHIYKGNLYRDGELVFAYDASKHGCVTAIQINFDEMRNSIATLAFAFEGVAPIKINWCRPTERDAFKYGINDYTVIIDKRYTHSFESYVK